VQQHLDVSWVIFGSRIPPTHIIPKLQIRCVKLTSTDTACVISLSNPMFDHLLESPR